MPLVLERSWIGMRVTVRRVVGRGPDGRLLLADVVGDLVEMAGDRAVLEARAGRVEIDVNHITAAKPAPPSTRDELALEAIAARGWQAEQTGELGGWLLRANAGFTGRANSVLPLGSPGRPLSDALDAARSWYAARELPLMFQVPVSGRRLLDGELAERGWTASPDVHVMAARLQTLLGGSTTPLGALPDRMPFVAEVMDRPDDAWFARYRDGAGVSRAARGLLTRHEQAGFACLRLDDGRGTDDGRGARVVAIGRGTIDDEWLGVTAVEVEPGLRRRGLASEVMRSLWVWGAERGAVRSHLEVAADNEPANALYRRLGYWVHHDYRYRTEPSNFIGPPH
jgi:ribosomal protein S18 acetylase RimI-like enzyme